jgi:Kef-type K+ transport system membrane component KefB
VVPADFTAHTDLITNIALAFITFSVGGTLYYGQVRRLGRSIFAITLCEAEFAFLVSGIGLLALAPLIVGGAGASWAGTYVPLALLLGCLASPTDPSATLAVTHEYKAKGPVTSTILGVTAFDDVLGIINFSVATAIAHVLITHQRLSVVSSVIHPAGSILGAILCGIFFALVFNAVTYLIRRETEGALIVMVLAMLALTFGVARWAGADELLATMTMGAVVVNYNARRQKIFRMLERYTEELIFVLFFTLSGMQLDFSVLSRNLPLILALVVFRAVGKTLGAVTGATLSGASGKVKRFAAGGLIPQGGIVVGLALLMKQKPAFSGISGLVISVVIGATVIHELIGPVISKMAIKAAGEIPEAKHPST